jgi:hypothetical protein
VNLQRHLGCPCFQHLLLLWGKWFTSWRRFSDDARNALHIFDVLLAPARRTIRHSIGGEVRQMVRLSGQALLDFGQSLGSHAIILAAGSAA